MTKEKEKDIKEKDLNYTKDKDRDNMKDKESELNEKERKDINGDELHGKDGSGLSKDLMTRQDKITEAFRLRAAASSTSSTSSSATSSSSASLSTAASVSATSASLSATATSAMIPGGMESDGSGISTPTKSNIGSRSPNLISSSSTSKAFTGADDVEFKEVRQMPVLVKESSPTSMSPVNTGGTAKIHGITSNSLGPVMTMDSTLHLTPNGTVILSFNSYFYVFVLSFIRDRTLLYPPPSMLNLFLSVPNSSFLPSTSVYLLSFPLLVLCLFLFSHLIHFYASFIFRRYTPSLSVSIPSTFPSFLPSYQSTPTPTPHPPSYFHPIDLTRYSGLPPPPPGVLMPTLDTTAAIRMARSQSYNEVSRSK